MRYIRLFFTFVLSLILIGMATSPALAQVTRVDESEPFTAEETDFVTQIVNTTFNQLPPFVEGGVVADLDAETTLSLGYQIGRSWQAGDLPVDVVNVGDLESGLSVEEFTLGQIFELSGIDRFELTLSDLSFLEGLTVADFIGDIPFLGDWPIEELSENVQALFNGGETLKDVFSLNADLAELPALEVLGDLNLSEIPNIEYAQLIDFEGIGNVSISSVPGLGDIPLGAFPNPLTLLNAFAKQDIAFSATEYSNDKPTPQPVSGGTNGSRAWESIPCTSGCAHIELTQRGWKGAQWMTKAHRVPDGYGVLGGLFGEAGAYRLPFGQAFALQVVDTDEKTGTAEWGIAFRVCHNGFIDLGCTAYFMEVPLGIETKEGDIVLTGLRDGKGGASEPIPAPPGWEELRPDTPSELTSIISANTPRRGGRRRVCGAASVSGKVVDVVTQSVSELGWPSAQGDVSLIIGTALENGITDPAHIAYIIATTAHESDGYRTMEEYGKGAGYDYGEDYGRGYIQVTWRENREKIDELLGINSADNPELLTDPEIAAQAAVIGMRDGVYTGVRLSDYGSGESFDWDGARSVVNNGDLRGRIGDYGRNIYRDIAEIDVSDVEALEGNCGGVSGGVASLGEASLEEILYDYEPADFQDFDAYRAYRSSYHGGLDLDYRAGFGEGGVVTSLTAGTVVSVSQFAEDRVTGEGSVQVVIETYDENGNVIRQRYNHLSESSVEAALGTDFYSAVGLEVGAGQQIGNVGGEDTVSSGAHLDYKVLVNGEFVNPIQFMEVLFNGDNGGTLETLDLSTGASGITTIGNVGGREVEEDNGARNADEGSHSTHSAAQSEAIN